MTFSDKNVVEFISANYTAVWESVSDVPVAVFDLGDGRQVKGAMGGEIAVYFCRPDGKAFDVLPALHSPAATLNAAKNALDFYRETGATDEAAMAYHSKQFDTYVREKKGVPDKETMSYLEALLYRRQTADQGTRALSELSMSKSGPVSMPEPITVVEPGGRELYKRPIHEKMATTSMKMPMEWKKFVFEYVLNQKLRGGEFVYDSSKLVPLAVFDE